MNIFKVLLFFAIGPAAWASQSQQLTYVSNQRQFQMIYSQQALSLNDGQMIVTIPSTACSRPLLETFWLQTVSEFSRLPNYKKKPYLQLNQEKRWIPPYDQRARRLSSIDQEIRLLQVKERRKCASKS